MDLKPTDKQPKHILSNSKNLLFKGGTYEYEYLVGSKTGYTNSSRNTLVSCAEKNGMRLIAVVMVEETPNQYVDTLALFNYGFNNFDVVNIAQNETRFHISDSGSFYSNNDIFGNSESLLTLNKDAKLVLPKAVAFTDLTSTISYDTTSKKQAALVHYNYNGHPLGTASIDFAGMTDPYAFEQGAMQPNSSHQTNEKEESPILFVNILRIIFAVLAFACGLIILISIISFFSNYQFVEPDRNNRKSWKREKRKRINHYQRIARNIQKRRLNAQKRRERRRSKELSFKNMKKK